MTKSNLLKNLCNASLMLANTLIQWFHQSTLDFCISDKQSLNVSSVKIFYKINNRED